MGANPKRLTDKVICYQELIMIHYGGGGWGPNAEYLDVNHSLLIPKAAKCLRFHLLHPLIMCIPEGSHNEKVKLLKAPSERNLSDLVLACQ